MQCLSYHLKAVPVLRPRRFAAAELASERSCQTVRFIQAFCQAVTTLPAAMQRQNSPPTEVLLSIRGALQALEQGQLDLLHALATAIVDDRDHARAFKQEGGYEVLCRILQKFGFGRPRNDVMECTLQVTFSIIVFNQSALHQDCPYASLFTRKLPRKPPDHRCLVRT